VKFLVIFNGLSSHLQSIQRNPFSLLGTLFAKKQTAGGIWGETEHHIILFMQQEIVAVLQESLCNQHIK
jgi:hypothetical protein